MHIMMTLADLPTLGIPAVMISCARCHRHADLDAALLRTRLGDAYPVPDVWRRTRCSVCGERRELSSRPAWHRAERAMDGPVTTHVGVKVSERRREGDGLEDVGLPRWPVKRKGRRRASEPGM